jgi:DNA-nicking Smr family endonuclease
MPRDKPRISRQDSELFRRSVGEISAIAQDRIPPAQRRPAPVIAKTLEDRDKVLREMLSDEYEPSRQALIRFLHECRGSGVRCVRIIHGKGHGSHQRKPVLKNKVNSWLHQINDVMAFCSAIPAHGGTGAVYVLLRRRP